MDICQWIFLVTKPPAIEAEDILLRILHHEFLQVIHVRLLETAKLLSITAGDVLFEKQ